MEYNIKILDFLLRSKRTKGLIFVFVFGLCVVATSSEATAQWWKGGKEEKQKETPRMTETELQSEVMSFADRYAVIMSNAFETFQTKSPNHEAQLIANDDMVYSSASAFTIAAGPNPQVALLDMAVLATLGRMIYEEHYRVKWGEPAEPMVRGFRQGEADIWALVKKVLTPEQQRELQEMIREWRKTHPEQLLFTYLRFSDFATSRQKSTLVKAVESGGLFTSVKQATQQVEETRKMAERAMFLVTRLPLLTGDFMNVWISRWLANPEMVRILTNMDQVSGSAGLLSKEMEKLPDRFAEERNITIDQVMDKVTLLSEKLLADVMVQVKIERTAAIDQIMGQLAIERKSLMQDLVSEEEGVRPLLAELNQTLTTGNNMITSANTLADRLNLGQPKEASDELSEPFNIKDYQETMVQALGIIEQVDGLLKTTERVLSSPGWEKTFEIFIQALDQAEKEGEDFVSHTFWQVMLLMLIFLFGLLIVLVCHQYFSKKVFGPKLNHEGV